MLINIPAHLEKLEIISQLSKMIKGYSDQSANPILSGGRYDDLLPRFNVDKTAVGFCFHMNHILKAIEKEGE